MLRESPRRSIRRPGYDYTRPGQYFITVVTTGREEVFGDVVNGMMHLSAEGMAVAEEWASLPRHYAHVSLDAFVVMPNHVHGVIELGHDALGYGKRVPLSEVVRGFKTYAARRVNGIRGVSGAPVWRRNYYDRIIRDERELQDVRRYIAENPTHWENDVENPRRRP